MPFANRDAINRHHAVAMALHWAMAVMMISLCAIGHLMQELPRGPWRGIVYDCHKQIGIAVLILAVIRLGWRLSQGAPALSAAMPARQRRAAEAVHLLLYLLMFAQPITGVLNSQAGGHPVRLLGVPLPLLVAKDADLHELAEGAHAALGWILVVLVAGHVAAALHHHYRLRDDTLARMLPVRFSTRSP